MPRAKHKRPATTPWNPDNNPFRRDMLRLKAKRPGWRPRWVAKRNITRYLEDGYQFANVDDYGGGVSDKIAGDGTSPDTKIRRRELVLMEMPESLALQRQKHFASVADRAEKSSKRRYDKEVKQVGAEPYDPGMVKE